MAHHFGAIPEGDVVGVFLIAAPKHLAIKKLDLPLLTSPQWVLWQLPADSKNLKE
jgi:hypothetical protein